MQVKLEIRRRKLDILGRIDHADAKLRILTDELPGPLKIPMIWNRLIEKLQFIVVVKLNKSVFLERHKSENS